MNSSIKIKNIISNKNQKHIIKIDYKMVNNNYFILKNKKFMKNTTSSIIKKDEKENNSKISPPNSYSLIRINANNTDNEIPIESYIILDNYDYEESIKYDKRSFWRILYICLIAKENVINILFFKTPLDLQSMRICLFVFVYSCDLAFNTIFYSNEKISDKYYYDGDNLILFTIINNSIQSILSSLIIDFFRIYLPITKNIFYFLFFESLKQFFDLFLITNLFIKLKNSIIF